MKNLRIFLIILILPTFFSCQEDELSLFDSVSNSLNLEESEFQANFIFNETITEKVIRIPVKCIGTIESFDRNYLVEIIDSLTTAEEGVHYVSLEDQYTISKGEYADTINLTLLRDVSLKDSVYNIGFTIKENENFKSGLGDMQIVNISVTDNIDTPPSWWSFVFIEGFAGKFSVTKFTKLVEVFGIPEDEIETWSPTSMQFGTLMNNFSLLKKFFIENEFYDEDGVRILINGRYSGML